MKMILNTNDNLEKSDNLEADILWYQGEKTPNFDIAYEMYINRIPKMSKICNK
jgi:hypothetical protein